MNLRYQAVYKIFDNNFKENRLLYGIGDLGEVYAISLAQTLGAYSLVTDDVKQGGPYMSLLQFEDDVMPFTFADVLILRYLMGITDASQTVKDFDAVNKAADLDWAFRSQLSRFIRRFLKDPYREKDPVWIREFEKKYGIKLEENLYLRLRGKEHEMPEMWERIDCRSKILCYLRNKSRKHA